MSLINHKVRIINHLQVGHLDWVETKDVESAIKEAKEVVKNALKPGNVPGGSKEENLGF